MNYKTTIVLLVLLLVVGGYFLIVERGQAPTPYDAVTVRDTGEGQPLWQRAFVGDDVQAVTIQQGGKRFVFSRDNDQWQQTEPVRFAINAWSARSLCEDAANLRYSESFVPGRGGAPALADLQLADPLAEVHLTLKDGDPVTLQLGRQAVGGRGYAMLAGSDRVYVVNDALHKQVLEKKLSDMRQKSLQFPAEGQARRVVLHRSGVPVEVAKTNGRWAFDGQHTGRASGSAISDLLSAVGRMYVRQFTADQPGDLGLYGLDRPARMLRVERSAVEDNAAEQALVTVLHVGSPIDLQGDQYFAAITQGDAPIDVVFTLNRSDVERLDKSADDLRDDRVTPLAASDVREAVIQRAGQPVIHVVKEPEGWVFGQQVEADFTADADLVSSLMDDLVSARADRYVTDDAPVGEPMVTASLTGIARSEPDVLRIFAHDQGDYLVYRNNEKVGYVVTQTNWDRLQLPMVSLRHRELLAWQADDVTQVEIEQADFTQLVFTRQTQAPDDAGQADDQPAAGTLAANWTLQGHQRFEQQALSDLLAALLPLRAKSWLTDPVQWGDRLVRISLTDAAGQTADLMIDLDHQHAQLAGIAEPFAISSRLIETAQAELRDRQVLSLSRHAIEQVVITRGDAARTIRRQGDDYVDEQGQTLDGSAPAGLFDTLTSLRAQRWASDTGQAEPTVSLAVHVSGGDVIELTLGLVDDQPAVQVHGRWYLLEQGDYDKLTAPPA